MTFFDTAEAYGPFTNETLAGKALAPVRDQVVIATKFAFDYDENGARRGLNRAPPTSGTRSRDRFAGCKPSGSTCYTSTASIPASPSKMSP